MQNAASPSPALDATHVREPDHDAARSGTDATGATVAGPGSPPSEVREEGDIRPGSVIKERFVIEAVLGRGGMGVVYRARDLRKEEARDRDPYVALKVLNEQFRRDSRMVIALQREARKAQTLAHPNITTVYDFDRDGDVVYITMEVLDGKPLNQVIEAHPDGMDKRRALGIVRGLCLGLAYAHNKSIVHSDFKPGNVFLTQDDRTKILDFGIARAAPLERREASVTTHFDAGALGALTPSYASCEMFEAREPHASDDVYALAIVAYQLLSGRHPFDLAPAPQARSRGMEPKPIRGLKGREWRAIRRGLEFERAKRSANAAEFLRELEGSPRLRTALAATALLLAAAGGYIGYTEYERIMAARPDVAFDALPLETQRAVRTALDEARTFEQFGDAAAALEQYMQAYVLHPRNPDAVAGLEALFDRLVGDVPAGSASRAELESVADNLEAVMATDGFLRSRRALVAARDSLSSRLDDS